MLVVVVCCCPTTVALPAAGEMVWLRGPTHVVKEATSRRWDTHPPARTFWTGIRWAWRTLGFWRPGLLGRVVGKAT